MISSRFLPNPPRHAKAMSEAKDPLAVSVHFPWARAVSNNSVPYYIK